MTRIKIMGLCLVAMFAMTAVAASAASAAEPAYYECAKVVGGKFEKGCKKEGTGKKAGYELKEGIGKGKLFKGAGKKATLHTPAAGGEVTCASFKDEGKVGTPTTQEKVLSSFIGCTLLGKKCTTTGQKAGTIKTNALKGELAYVEGGAASHTVGIDLSPESGTQLAAFNCEGLAVTVEGAVVGQETPVNVLTKTENTVFEVNGEGFQKYKGVEGDTGDVLLSTFTPGGGPFESGQEASAANKGEELEIKA